MTFAPSSVSSDHKLFFCWLAEKFLVHKCSKQSPLMPPFQTEVHTHTQSKNGMVITIWLQIIEYRILVTKSQHPTKTNKIRNELRTYLELSQTFAQARWTRPNRENIIPMKYKMWVDFYQKSSPLVFRWNAPAAYLPRNFKKMNCVLIILSALCNYWISKWVCETAH